MRPLLIGIPSSEGGDKLAARHQRYSIISATPSPPIHKISGNDTLIAMAYRTPLLIAFASSLLFASETRIKMQDLPEAVQKTVREQTKNAELRGLAKETEAGKTFYEAETKVNGKSRDILIDPTGNVVEVEESIALESIPEAARKGLLTKAGSGKILSAESVTKGSIVSYEAVVLRKGKKSEVVVNADGTSK